MEPFVLLTFFALLDMHLCPSCRAPLPSVCREFCCGFFLWIVCPSFKGTEGPKKSTEKVPTKIHDKIHALRMKIHHEECSAEVREKLKGNN